MVKELLKDHQHKEYRRKKAEDHDRGQGGILQSCTADDIKAVVRYCWQGWKANESRNWKARAQESQLRTAIDFLFSHSMLLRGENRRGGLSGLHFY